MTYLTALKVFTAMVLAAFAIAGVALYLSTEEGVFPLYLVVATAVAGLYWLVERLYFLPQRRAQSQHLTGAARAQALRQPWWLDWTAGLFPVLCAVFLLRSFVFEPFRIPTGSMIPTLLVGDMIVVNKFQYGLRLPVLNTKVVDVGNPQRGDVMVFRFPPDPRVNYVKRVVGLPGDEISYINKVLTINGQTLSKLPQSDFLDEDTMQYAQQFEEMLGDKRHRLLNVAARPASVTGAGDFPFRDQCRYTAEGIHCKVPAGHYFMMGDNRDNSLDSRYWGFVPEANIVGKAAFIWMNFGRLGRIGPFQ